MTIKVGVGMPAYEYLEIYAEMLRDAFSEIPYLVGSALQGKQWRDVDVRLILSDEEWERQGFGDPIRPNKKWTAYVTAFSELGRKLTGLPIDFQIQHATHANEHYSNKNSGPERKYPRSALGVIRKL